MGTHKLRREVTMQVPRALPTSLPTRASTQGVILYVNLLFFNSRPESATWSITDMGQVSGGPEGHDLSELNLSVRDTF